MLIRRFGQNRRNIGLATAAVAFIFCVYLYYDLHSQLKQNDERNQRLKALQSSLSTQLRVVYEHKSRLERAIQDEKDSHHKTKEAKQDLEMKFNREKQEMLNRIQTVNQKQRILETQFEDLQKELLKSEADFQHLKIDHQREIEEYKEKIILQSKQCDNDRKYLSDEIDEFKILKKEISQSLAECQESLKVSEFHANALKERNARHLRLEENADQPGTTLNESVKHVLHIDHVPLKVTEAAFANDFEKTFNEKSEKENHVRDASPSFHSDNGLSDVGKNQTLKLQDEDEQHLQAVPPPPLVIGKLEPKDNGKDPEDQRFLDRVHDHADAARGMRSAVIEAPKELERNQPPNKILEQDDDREDAGMKDGQNEADQKEEDDYQYDKNAADDDDDEKKEEKADDFQDPGLANKNFNKIQNPVYPDDVEVINH